MFKKKDWANEKTFGSALQYRKTERLLVLDFEQAIFAHCANFVHMPPSTKLTYRIKQILKLGKLTKFKN